MPQIPGINPLSPGAVGNSGISVSSPVVSDKSNAAKAANAEVYQSLFKMAGQEYEQKRKKAERAARVMTATQEGVDAQRFGDQVFQQAKALPNGEREKFVVKSFEDRISEKKQQFGNDPELWTQIYGDTQRVGLQTEHSTFNYTQERIKSDNIAALIEGEGYMMSRMLDANETERLDMFRRQREGIEQAVDAGWIDADKGVLAIQKFQSDSVKAVISNSIVRGDTGSAEAYLNKYQGQLDAQDQVQLAGMIINERERQDREAQAAIEKEAARRSDLMKLHLTDPGAWAVESGADSVTAIYKLTNGQSVVPNLTAKQYVSELSMLTNTDQKIQGLMSLKEQFKGPEFDVLMKQMVAQGLPDQTRSWMQLVEDGATDQAKLLGAAVQDKKGVEDAFGFSSIQPKVLKEAIASTSADYIQSLTQQPGGASLAASQMQDMELAAKAYINKHPGTAASDAAKWVVDGFTKNTKTFRVGSSILRTTANYDADGQADALQALQSDLNPADLALQGGGNQPITFRSNNSGINLFLGGKQKEQAYWVTNANQTGYDLVFGENQVPVMYKSSGKPISLTADRAVIIKNLEGKPGRAAMLQSLFELDDGELAPLPAPKQPTAADIFEGE